MDKATEIVWSALVTSTVWVAKPTELICKVNGKSLDVVNVKFPSKSVAVPVFVPTKTTLAAGRGC